MDKTVETAPDGLARSALFLLKKEGYMKKLYGVGKYMLSQQAVLRRRGGCFPRLCYYSFYYKGNL